MPKPVGPWVISFLALALAAGGFLRSGRAPPTRERPEPAAPDAFEFGSVQREIARLDSRVLSLESAVVKLGTATRVAEIKADPNAPAVVVVPAQTAEIAARLDAIDHDVSRIALDRALSTEEGQTRLRSLIKEERARGEQEDRGRWRTRTTEFTKEFVAKFAEEANLTTQQKEGIEAIVLRSSEEQSALRERLRTQEIPRTEARKEMNAQREKSEQELRQHLSEEQVELFKQKRDEMRRSTFGGGQ